MFLLAWPNVDSACVTKHLRLKRLMQRHVCCFNLKPVAIVVHHLYRCFGGRICSTNFHISQASKTFSCTLSSEHQHLPYKTPFCFFKTTRHFCSSHSEFLVMTLICVHDLSGFLLLPQTLHIHSADAALCCAPFVSLQLHTLFQAAASASSSQPLSMFP